MSDLYVYTGDGSCRSCGAPILWFRTPAGKNMPIDDVRGVLPGRGALTRRDTATSEEAQEGLLPFTHFKTCPNAARHRRG